MILPGGRDAMTWQVAVFVVYRVATALPTLRWPFAGALIAIVGDFCDLFLMDWIGGIPDYQSLDKVCDLAYMFTFLVVALRWAGLERAVAVGLFFFRMIGDALFEVSGDRLVLLLFPNVFEFWFIAVAAWHHYRPRTPLAPRHAAVALVALLLGKEAQEYFLHYDRFLDQFSAIDAATGIWRWLAGS